jgi:hypothetical protein
MLIDSNACIAGIPVIRIRHLFRQAGLRGILNIEFVRETLGLTDAKAKRLCAALAKTGFLEPQSCSKAIWNLTKDGIRLRGATATKPLHRKTADRLISDLLIRISMLNKSSHFLARVQQAIVFGSYLGNGDRIGDVDIAIELVRRESDFDKHCAANSKRVREETERGRSFQNMVDEIYWWHREAMLFLRNRKRGLSLHEYQSERSVVESGLHKVIFCETERTPAARLEKH